MRLAVIGQGSAGRRHARHLLEMGHEVMAFDPQSVPAEGAAPAASVTDAVADAEAVVVASPSSMHREHALEALTAGRPVLVEKPLATTATEAEEIAEAASRAGVVAGVAMNWRFHWAVVALRELLRDGSLGRPLMARASFGSDLRGWRPGADYRRSYSANAGMGGGVILDAIHEIDYLHWLLGPVESVVAELGHLSSLDVDVEDAAVAALRFRSGALATLDLNFFEQGYRRGAVVVGEEATAQWDTELGRLRLHHAGGSEDVPVEATPIEETYRAELEDFVAAVAASRTPRAGMEDGVHAVRVAQAIKTAAAGGTRVTLTPDG